MLRPNPRRKITVLLAVVLVQTCRPTKALYLQARWSANQTQGKALCHEPEVEFAEEGLREDFVYPIFHRQSRALVSGNSRARHLEERSARNAAEQLEKVYEHDVVVSESMLEEGLSNLGDTVNIRRAMHKLVTGRPIKVVALGGSVTKGHGPQKKINGYLNRVYEWINETFPHPEHQLINQAIPAVTSAYVSPCVLNLVPSDTDLVLIEFTLNDSEMSYTKRLDEPTTRGLERMLRKLMRLENQPGIIYVHYWAGRELQDKFTFTSEDAINTILKFYGVMGLSMRDSIHQLQIANEGNIMEQIYHPNTSWDKYHPTCIGSRYLADLVVGHLQMIAASEVVDHHTDDPPDDYHLARMHHNRVSIDLLGPPLQADNWANLTETCLLENDMKGMVRPGQGFEWVDEGKRGSPKWGFVSRRPGDSLEVDVALKGLKFVDNALTIGLGFLVSYEHMGMANVTCVAGCECKQRRFNFLHPAWELGVSLTAWKPVDVSVREGSQKCILKVTVLNETKSDPPEHKVKLTSVMISAEKGFIMPCGGGECFQ